jgi:hypothetical protein
MAHSCARVEIVGDGENIFAWWLSVAGLVLALLPCAAQEDLFAPPNDISFSIWTERHAHRVGEPIVAKYRIVKISNHRLFVPQGWDVKCPPSPMSGLGLKMPRASISFLDTRGTVSLTVFRKRSQIAWRRRQYCLGQCSLPGDNSLWWSETWSLSDRGDAVRLAGAGL